MPKEEVEVEPVKTADGKLVDPALIKALTTRAERKEERLKMFVPPEKDEDKITERDERIEVWQRRYGLYVGDIQE